MPSAMNVNDRSLPQAAPGASVSITQQVYGKLRDEIVTGALPPGEKLKVDTLKERLSVGASPIREALSLLTSDQLVERLDQRGFRVAHASQAEFAEILKLRCDLEDMALRESLNAATPAWEDALVLAHHRLVRTPRGDVATFEAHHKAFHMALLSAAPSPILLRFCDRLYDLNIRYRYLAGRTHSYQSRDVSSEHADILAAACARDADATSDCLLKHYRRTGQYLSERLENADFIRV